MIRPENRERAVKESDRLKTEIDNLVPYRLELEDPEDHENADNIISILLHFVIFFSMIDGAFLSYMTENTTDQRCPFCHMLPR